MVQLEEYVVLNTVVVFVLIVVDGAVTVVVVFFVVILLVPHVGLQCYFLSFFLVKTKKLSIGSFIIFTGSPVFIPADLTK